MNLTSISITNVRNIQQVNINFGNRFNVFYGENGAGKSSILEAIYLLSTGKSFRTQQIKKIISHCHSSITLFAKVEDENGMQTALGLSKSEQGNEIRINGQNVKNISELALRLPVLVTTQDSHKLIDSGPHWRRQFLDWGLFHVKHEFHETWKNYRKLLKQRNSALCSGYTKEQITVWDDALIKYGEMYDQLRTDFVSGIEPYFIEFSQVLLGENEYNLEYLKGWPRAKSFSEILKSHFEKDRLTRRTEYGPHRADLRVLYDSQNGRDTASRGQQKLLVYALNLALIAYLKASQGVETIMLLDDLGSELDTGHASKLLNLLRDKFSQVCITTANLETLPLNTCDVKLFHVKHGEVTEV